VVDYVPRHPRVKGSSPVTAAGTKYGAKFLEVKTTYF